eukprot:COSAG01_NODE_5533_length_4202_cov_46.375091_4_plen_92_part_01
MKGVDPNSTRELPSVGISPAEARRRGVTAGQTPGTAAATNARCACAAIHCRPVIVTASLYPHTIPYIHIIRARQHLGNLTELLSTPVRLVGR